MNVEAHRSWGCSLTDLLAELMPSLDAKRVAMFARRLAREWFVDVDSLRLPRQVLVPWLLSRDDLRPLAAQVIAFADNHQQALAPPETPTLDARDLPLDQPTTTVADVMNRLADLWKIEDHPRIPEERKMLELEDRLKTVQHQGLAYHLRNGFMELGDVLPFRAIAVLQVTFAAATSAHEASLIRSFLDGVKSQVDPQAVARCFTIAPTVSTSPGASYEEFLCDVLNNLRKFDGCEELFKLVARNPEFAQFSDKSVFVLLMELLPQDAWFIGHLYARSLKPIPLFFPFPTTAGSLGHKLVLSSLPCALQGDDTPLAVSFGRARIGKTSFLRSTWHLSTGNHAADELFHDMSADIYPDGVLEVPRRGFHLIDVHGDWQRCQALLSLLVAHCSLVLVHLRANDFGPDGELVARDMLGPLLANRPGESRAVVVVHGEREAADFLPTGRAWEQTFAFDGRATSDVRLLATTQKDPNEADLLAHCTHPRGRPSYWQWAESLATLAKRVPGLTVVEPSSENKAVAAETAINITPQFSAAACMPFLRADPPKPLQELSKAVKQYLGIVRRKDISSLVVMADQVNRILRPGFANLLADQARLQENHGNLMADQNPSPAALKAREDNQKELRKLNKKLDDAKVELNLFWRELLSYISTPRLGGVPAVVAQDMAEWGLAMARRGFQMELINGERLSTDPTFLSELRRLMTESPQFKSSLVVTVLGPQSHGKSTLLNFLYGSQFMTSPIRCTSGFNTTFLEHQGAHTDSVFVGDTEGIMSAERERRQQELFDRTLTFFCLLMSDVLLINVRATADANIRSVLEVALYALEKLNRMPTAKVLFVLRDMGANPIDQSRREAYESLSATIDQISAHFSVPNLLDFRREDIWLMPAAFDTLNRPNPQFVVECNRLRDYIASIKPATLRTPAQCIADVRTVWSLARSQEAVQVLNFANMQRFLDWGALNVAATALIKAENPKMNQEWTAARDEVLTRLQNDRQLRKDTIQREEHRTMTFIANLVTKYARVVMDRLKQAHPDLKEEDLDRMGQQVNTSFANERKCFEQELKSALSKLQTVGLLRTAQDRIRDHLVEVRERQRKDASTRIDEAAAQLEFEKLWADETKAFSASLAADIITDAKTLFSSRITDLYKVWNGKQLGSRRVVVTISLEKARGVLSEELLEGSYTQKATRQSLLSTDGMCDLIKSLLPMIGSTRESDIYREVAMRLNNFLDLDVAKRPVDFRETTISTLAEETANLLASLDILFSKIHRRLRDVTLSDVVHSQVAWKVASNLAQLNAELIAQLKRDFEQKKTVFGSVYITYRCGSDGDKDRAQSLGRIVSWQMKKKLQQHAVNQITQLLSGTAMQPLDLIRHCYNISFTARDWPKVLSYVSNAHSFMNGVFLDDWDQKVNYNLAAVKNTFQTLCQALLDEARQVTDSFVRVEQQGQARDNQGDDAQADLMEQAAKLWQRLFDTCIKRTWVHVGDLFGNNSEFESDFRLMDSGVFDLHTFVTELVGALTLALTQPLDEEQLKEDLSQELTNRRTTAVGCSATCPYCSQKCCNPANHQTSHSCENHFFHAFRGWHSRRDNTDDQSQPTMVMCNSTARMGHTYKVYNGDTYLPFEDHVTQCHETWSIGLGNIDETFLESQLRAWKAVGRILCHGYGVTWAAPDPQNFPSFAAIDQPEYTA